MPNDVPDWTRVHAAQLVGSLPGLVPLGDTSQPDVAPDSAQYTSNLSGSQISGLAACIASFKAAVGSVIAKVQQGTITGVSAASITPSAWPAPTTNGNLIIAWVKASSSNDVATASPGWLKAVSGPPPGQDGVMGIFYKPNCGAGEAAPTFTSTGAVEMWAQLFEVSGADTSPLDQVKANLGVSLQNQITVTNPAPDVAFGDLVMLAVDRKSVV